MNEFETLPDPVQWSEGMLLSPQHLQQNDIYWHHHLAHRMRSVTPHYWGMRELTLAGGKPRNGVVEVDTLECVLDDGALVQYPGNQDRGIKLAADVSEYCKQPGDQAIVWLIINDRGVDAASGQNKKRRFRSLMAQATRDENTGEGDVPVGRIQLRIKLQATAHGAPAPQTSFKVPLLKVETDSQRHLHVSSYHPPMLRLDACVLASGDASLQARCHDTVQKLWEKVRSLGGQRGDDKDSDRERPGVENREHLAVARGLASVLPLLDILASDPSTHPSRMYEAFALAVGHVAGIGANPIPLQMKVYRHEDCMPQFEEVFQYINAKLNLVHLNHDFLPFATPNVHDLKGYHCFARRMSEEVGDSVLVEVHCRADFLPELDKWLDQVHIVSDSQLKDAKLQRWRGAERKRLSAAELKKEGLPAGAIVLRISNDPKSRKFVLPKQALMLLTADNEPKPQALTLVTHHAHAKEAQPARAQQIRSQNEEEIHEHEL